MGDAAYPTVSESDWLASTTASAQSKPSSSSSSSQSARVPRSPYSSAPPPLLEQQQRTACTDSSSAPFQSPPNSAEVSRLYFPTVPSRTSSAASNQSSAAYSSAEYPTRGASLGAAAARDPSPSLPPRPTRDDDHLVDADYHPPATATTHSDPNANANQPTTSEPPLSMPMPTPIPIPVPEPATEAPYGALPLSNTDSSAYSLDMTTGSPPPASSGVGLGFDSPHQSLGADATPQFNSDGGGGADPPPALPPRHRETSPRGDSGGGAPTTSTAPELPPRQPSLLSIQSRTGGVDTVPTEFDEGALRALCDMDCGTPLLLDRMKQSMTSCREASTFFKKRAQIEEDYARSLAKLAKSSAESYSAGDGKAGSYVSSWLTFLRTHELVGETRLKFAAQLSEMSDELTALGKEVDKNRKSAKELASKLEKGLQEQDALVDRARVRFDSAAEDLERLLVLKQGEMVTPSSVPHAGSSHAAGASSKGRSFGKAMSKLKGPKNAAQYAKQEEEVRSRMGQTSDSYRAQVSGAQSLRQEYFQTQLPRLLRTLKENVDELDLGTQYHLSRYAYLLENVLVTEGLTIAPVAPEDGPGLKAVIESIDSREDFKTYMQQYSLNWQMSGQQRGPKREGFEDENFSPVGLAPSQPYGGSPSQPSATPTFGVDLGEQMLRDGVEVPRVLEKCAEAIELYGLESKGIYRLSGTTSRVQRLKAALDYDTEAVDLLSEENLSDINDIAAVLKLWFRELPEPLLTWELYHAFINAAKIDNDRLRHIRLHERINELPDPNYATLKFLMGHLDKVAQHEAVNQMSRSNLAIVFGPNLLGAPPPHLAHLYPGPAATASGADGTPSSAAGGGGGGGLQDMQWQCKCIETILLHFVEIFVE